MSQTYLYLSFFFFLVTACSSGHDKNQTGIPLSRTETEMGDDGTNTEGSVELRTKPGNVLLTAYPDHRLIPVYKVNYDSRRKVYFTGSNHFHHNDTHHYYKISRSDGYGYYEEEEDDFREIINSWHGHFMPGLEAVYGYNLLNMAHFNTQTKVQNQFFENPVLINTVYFPALLSDTLNGQPVTRNYYLVSVYDEDTNRDSTINHRDLRHFYHFDLEGQTKTLLIPADYSVLSSEYDPENDYMYLVAKQDQNANGKREEAEPVHVFWIDLKAPAKAERLY